MGEEEGGGWGGGKLSERGRHTSGKGVEGEFFERRSGEKGRGGVVCGRREEGGFLMVEKCCLGHNALTTTTGLLVQGVPSVSGVAHLGLGILEVLLGLLSTNSDPPHN